MTELVITSADQLAALSVPQIEDLAANSLSWDYRGVDSMRDTANGRLGSYQGHNRYTLSGHPAQLSGKTFTSRREYLTYRLTQRINRTGAAYNALGKVAATAAAEAEKARKKAEREAKKKAAAEKLAKEIAERAQTPQTFVEVVVKAAVAERIPNYRNKSHKINIYPEGERMVLQRAADSDGKEICQEKVRVKRVALQAGIKALKDNKDVLKATLPDFPEVEGLSFETPQVAGITVRGDNPEDYSPNSTLVFNWDAKNEDHILMKVQDWTFRFHIDDFSSTLDAIDQKWTAVKAKDTPVAS